MNWRSTTYLEIQNRLLAFFAAPYNTNMFYYPDMLCHYQNNWYICTANTAGNFNAANWQLLPSPTTTQHANYNPNYQYNVGDYCFHLGYLFKCTTATIGAFDVNNWEAINHFRHLRWLDVFNNQYNYFESQNEMPIPLPVIFIEFHQTEWTASAGGTQQGECLIRIHVVLETYHQSYLNSFDQSEALDRFDFIELVQLALQGYSGTYFNALNRRAEVLDSDHSNVMVHIIDYSTQIMDNSAIDNDAYIEPIDVHVNPDYDNPVTTFNRLGSQITDAINNNQTDGNTNNPYYVD